MTAPDSRDSVERVVSEMRRGGGTETGWIGIDTARGWADRLQALARGPQQAGGEDARRVDHDLTHQTIAYFNAMGTTVATCMANNLAAMEAALREAHGLLGEVVGHYTRDDDLPNNLLPRIDAAIGGTGDA